MGKPAAGTVVTYLIGLLCLRQQGTKTGGFDGHQALDKIKKNKEYMY